MKWRCLPAIKGPLLGLEICWVTLAQNLGLKHRLSELDNLDDCVRVCVCMSVYTHTKYIFVFVCVCKQKKSARYFSLDLLFSGMPELQAGQYCVPES